MPLLQSFIEFLTANPIYVVLGFLFYVALFLLSIVFSKKPAQLNPFRYDCTSKPLEPLVTDQTSRDKVLKQGFVMKRVPEDLDAIIIGSGMGALTTAGLMAKSKKKVLVLEQHDRAGGCCHTYIEDGFEFDVGIHYVGETAANTLMHCLLKQLTDGQLQWNKLEDIYDKVFLGDPASPRKYNICTGIEEQKAEMIKNFPDEKKGIEKYFKLLRAVRKSFIGMLILKALPVIVAKFVIKTGLVHLFTNFFAYSKKSLQQTVDELTTNEDLKAVMCYNFGDYGTVPSKTAFTMQAVLVNHFMRGSYYPVGGASQIAFTMIPAIERAGGRVLVRAKVTQVLFNDKGKAIGVRIHKGGNDHDIFAPVVISDAGVPNTFQRLVPKEIALKSPIYDLLRSQKIQSGMGAMSVFIGLKGTKEELNLKAENIWAFTGNRLSDITEEYYRKSAVDVMDSDIPLIFLSFPSTKDPHYSERFPGKSTAAMVTLCNYEWFKQWEDERVMHRGEDYDYLKNTIAKRMWEQVLNWYPQLRDKVEYFEVGSPLSNNFYIGSPKGEIYGLDHNVGRFSPDAVAKLRPETGIPGLYLTGQDVLSCGFAGAMFGGVLCASKVLNRNLFNDLMTFRKQIIEKEIRECKIH